LKGIRLLLEHQLPHGLRDYGRNYDAKGFNQLLARAAREHPEEYSSIIGKIADVGRNASYDQGESLTLEDLKPVIDKDSIFKGMEARIAQAKKGANTDAEFRTKRMKIWQDTNEHVTRETQREGLRRGNNIAYSVLSGARGKAPQLNSMISAPGIFQDGNGTPIEMYATHSHAEGLRPAEFLASTYGARSAVISTKKATAVGGDFSKQLSSLLSTLNTTRKSTGSDNGVDLDIEDPSLKYRVLAKPAGGFSAGTMITTPVLAELRRKKVPYVIAHSPITDDSPEGIASESVGGMDGGHLYGIGRTAGITAANSIGEPITQSALNVKHCLKEGTMVRMADLSVKPIQEIKAGEWVLGSDITGATFPVKVKYVWDQGIQPVQRYIYKQGQTKRRLTLECTDTHIVLSNKKTTGEYLRKKYAGKYGFGCPENYLACKLPAGYPHKNIAAVLPVECKIDAALETHEPLAVLCGALLGDGIRWDSENHADASIRFSCADPMLIADLQTPLATAGLALKKRKRSHDYAIVHTSTQGWGDRSATTGQMVKTATRHPMKVKMLEWGIANKYAHEKRVPVQALYWDKASVSALLAGFIATDGSIGKNKAGHVFISFASTSRGMLEDLRRLLELRLCVYTSEITNTAKAGTRSYKHDAWAFAITRQDQIQKLVGMLPPIPGCKGPRTKDLLENANYELRNPELFYRAKRESITEIGNHHCWDITVDHPDELFVLENGLIVKNTAGVAGKKREFSGMNAINAFVQSPEAFPDKAPVSELEGTVHSIKDAPQGGKFAYVGDHEHYIPEGLGLLVKPGDKLEAGDALSEGIVDPRDIVRLRGLGEGRRYYATRLKQLLDDSGIKTDLKHTEMVARGALDHVRITDAEGLGDYLPDDTVSYNKLAASYVPPADSERVHPGQGVGRYLQAPALHYTIGTKLTPRMAEHLASRGYDKVAVANDAPGFEPDMDRLRTAGSASTDWASKLTSSYVAKNMAESAVRGGDSDFSSNISPYPRLAIGKNFANDVEKTGKF
jgi:hypothetical protein